MAVELASYRRAKSKLDVQDRQALEWHRWFWMGDLPFRYSASPNGFPNVASARLVASVSAALSAISWTSPGEVPRPSPVP